MKKSHKNGFTLIEILLVIAIIGILAAILVPVVGGVMDKVTKTTTRAKFSEWVTAIKLYKTTYGYYPVLNSGASSATADTHYNLAESKNSINFVKALSGRDPETGDELSKADSRSLNKREKEFCQFDDASYTQADGTVERGKLVDGFYNPNIHVILDTDMNRRVIIPQAYLPEDATEEEKNPKGMSGKEIIIFTSKKDGEDYADIYSWDR